MRQIEDNYQCFCGNIFTWKFTKLDKGEIFIGREDDRTKNVKNYCETYDQYIVEIKCPYCNKNNSIKKHK